MDGCRAPLVVVPDVLRHLPKGRLRLAVGTDTKPCHDMESPTTRTSTKEEVTAQETHLQEADDQSGPVDADITQLAEQRAMKNGIFGAKRCRSSIAQASLHTAELPATLPPARPLSACMLTCRKSGPSHASVCSYVTCPAAGYPLPRALTHMQTATGRTLALCKRW